MVTDTSGRPQGARWRSKDSGVSHQFHSDRPRGLFNRATFTAVFGVMMVAVLLSCQPAPRHTRDEAPRQSAIATEVATVNLAAYPEGTYTVVAGDTPRIIAAKLGIDYESLVDANGMTDKTVLQPGDVLVAPKVAPRNATLSTAGARGPQEGASAAAQVVDAAGNVRAIAAGVVSEVHRGYPGLGDVVIIENDAEKVIYSGTFTPSVAKGAAASVGSIIGRAVVGKITATSFAK